MIFVAFIEYNDYVMKTKFLYIGIIFFLLVQVVIVAIYQKNTEDTESNITSERKAISYVPIGDSYTIGLGVKEDERWPNVLVGHLNEKGVSVIIADNPSVSGYTVRNAIDYELPTVEKIKPDFVTVFIGANDNFAQRSAREYENDLTELLDKLQSILDEPKNIVLVTIPDYSKAPAVNEEDNDTLTNYIKEYNKVIKGLAVKRDLKVADIFTISQEMTDLKDYINDGLHPSGFGYEKWESVILPVVLELLLD